MREFTLSAYRQYLKAIKSSYPKIITFADYFSTPSIAESFIIIRHDVDRKPRNAIKMAMLESDMGIRSTFYFRTKSHVFKPEIISHIATLGHEIGYHYESLSDARGNHEKALIYFEQDLKKLRKIVPIKTIAMHGSPISPFDNSELWKKTINHNYLNKILGIDGEIYLDINYSDIAYISDTGRNWSAELSNRRDRVKSLITPNIKNSSALLDCFKKACYIKVVFQVHPERWSDSFIEYWTQYVKDNMANLVKEIAAR